MQPVIDLPATTSGRKQSTPQRPGAAALQGTAGSTSERTFSWTLIAAVFVLALAGRFSLDRLGLSIQGVSDPRMAGCVFLVVAVLVWQAGRAARGEVQPMPGVALLFSALIGFQLLSALWSPTGARLERVSWDLVVLWVLVIATAVFAAGDPRRAARVLLVLLLATAILYAAKGFLEGPQGQGRYSAFGSGPNVFARVIATGIIANVTLAVVHRRKLLLLPLPILAPAAVLSGSRGALVSLVGAAVVFFLLFVRRRRLLYLTSTVIVGAVLSWTAWTLFGSDIATLVSRRYSLSGLQQTGFSDRPMLLSFAWSMFAEHPLSGGGLDGFFATYGIDYPHNYFLQLAAESGIAAVCLLVLIAVSWWRGGRPWSTTPKEQVGCAVVAIYVAFASSFSGDYYDTRFLWIFAVAAVIRPRQARPDPGNGLRSGRPAGSGYRSTTPVQSRGNVP
ncbi:O-antigen ligase [Micromonospora inositola]|uniref:O-antigen ligase n=1 Tax=Micromonospora inositola TaxID=47865 RepID=A0A1C5K189_9ACTN|nr:O-antigen ligase [Micromonospora inositola]